MIILVGVLKSNFAWKGGNLAVKTKLPWAMEHPLGGPRKSAAPHVMLGVRAACSRFPGLKGRKTGCQGLGFPDWEFLDIYGKDAAPPTGGGPRLAPESIKPDAGNFFEWGDPDFPFTPMIVLTNVGAYNMINYTTGDWGPEGQNKESKEFWRRQIPSNVSELYHMEWRDSTGHIHNYDEYPGGDPRNESWWPDAVKKYDQIKKNPTTQKQQLTLERDQKPSLHQRQDQQRRQMKNTPNYNERDFDDEGN
jgi:hypothetical protein